MSACCLVSPATALVCKLQLSPSFICWMEKHFHKCRCNPVLKLLNPADRAEKRGPSFLGTKTSFNIADWLPRHVQENWELNRGGLSQTDVSKIEEVSQEWICNFYYLFLHLSKNKTHQFSHQIVSRGSDMVLRLSWDSLMPQFAKDGTKQVKGLL